MFLNRYYNRQYKSFFYLIVFSFFTVSTFRTQLSHIDIILFDCVSIGLLTKPPYFRSNMIGISFR